MPYKPTPESIRTSVEAIYERESRRVFATLIRLLGEFDLAEEALHDAFAAAMEQWPRDGVPANPRAWLVSTGRFKAIDALRRRARFDASLEQIADRLDRPREDPRHAGDESFADDQLRLIFTCCHPALPPESQVALTLREVCGLTTEEIASAFLSTPPTIAQRIVRGKAKIRDAGIPYQVPSLADLPERVNAVLAVIYLVFNEGYSATSGHEVTRSDLSGEAIRLGRLLQSLHDDAEVSGLLALMVLQESRRAARSSPSGDLILLEQQDRTLWNREQIAEGIALVARAIETGSVGGYTIQAAIAAEHAQAATPEDTNWTRIVGYYDLLLQATRSPIVELNRAVAVAMRDGPQAGLAIIEGLLSDGQLANYHLVYAAAADLYRRLQQPQLARTNYLRALEFARQEPERRFLQQRLQELES